MSALWEQEGLHYEADIQEGISLQGVPDDLYELVSILLDNARKYCDPQGTVRLQLANYKPWLRKGRAVLTVSNDYAAGQGQDYRLFFDRFYRSDQSRTRQVVSPEGASACPWPKTLSACIGARSASTTRMGSSALWSASKAPIEYVCLRT